MIIILISKQMDSEPFFSKDHDDFSSQSIGSWDKRVGKQHIWQFIFPGDFTLVLTLHLSDSDLFQQSRCCFSYSYVIFYVFREKNNMIWHFVERHVGHVPENLQFLLYLVPQLQGASLVLTFTSISPQVYEGILDKHCIYLKCVYNEMISYTCFCFFLNAWVANLLLANF